MINFTNFDWYEQILDLSNSTVCNDRILITFVSGIVFILLALKVWPSVRSWFPVPVNCWFCNTNCKVPVERKNSWYCKNCHQYNGFAEDGDYNKSIPEQYYESLNPQYAERSIKRPVATSNGLCKSCNIDQELKRAQLASFEPLDQNNYDWEVERYSELLEKNYKLCPYCEKVVSNTLKSQMNLNVAQLLTTAGHKLATSSVRFLSHESSPVYLPVILNSTKNSLWISSLLSFSLLLETNDNSSLKTAFNEGIKGYFVTTDWHSQFLPLMQTASNYFGDHLWALNFVLVTYCSLTQTLKRYNNRIFIDYITQLLWAALLFLEFTPVFMKTQLEIKSLQIMVLALIFTAILFKFVYFKYFFFKSDKNSPKLNSSPSVNVSPQTAKRSRVPLADPLKNTPFVQKDTCEPKHLDHSWDSDLGIGALNLGPNQLRIPSKQSTKNVFSANNDSFPTKRRPLILPSRLNFNLKNELSEINIPFSRPSSQSSGYETLNKSGCNSQNSSLSGDEDYNMPIKSSSPLQMTNYRSMPPFLPSAGPSQYELYTYYHFTAKFQASYGAQPQNVSTCSSCDGSVAQLNTNKVFLLIFLLFSILFLHESIIFYTIYNR